MSRVALDTGELTPVAQLPKMPLHPRFDTRLMFAADGVLLAPDVELGMDIWEAVPDEERKAVPPVEPSLNL